MPKTRYYVLFRSSFRYESAPNISHETIDKVRTLCGRSVDSAETLEPDDNDLDPDCRTCARKARSLRAARAFKGSPVKTDTREKHQTPAQRVTNAPWLRGQVADLAERCREAVAEDQAQADQEVDPVRRARYEASVDCHRHWRRQLERVLRGRTIAEELRESKGT